MNKEGRNIKKDFCFAWEALSENTDKTGLRTYPISEGKNYIYSAAVTFPSKEKSVLIGFNGLSLMPSRKLPQCDGFEFKHINIKEDNQFCWFEICFKNDPTNYYSLSLIEFICSELQAMCEKLSVSALFNHVINGIAKWQNYMQKIAKGTLSQDDELGLFGELIFLDSLVEHISDYSILMDYWQGPEGEAKDFVLPRCSVEIKTGIGNASTFNIHISSLDQLDNTSCAKLFLECIRVSVSSEGESLPELIDKIREKMNSDLQAINTLNMKLMQVGYLDYFSNLYERKYKVEKRIVFPIDSLFPCLKHSNVPSEIVEAKYILRLSESQFATIEEESLISDYLQEVCL